MAGSLLQVWIPHDLKQRLKRASVEHEVSMTDLTITALQEYLEQLEELAIPATER